MKIALVLTAAGSSSRFGGDKLAYPIDGKPMLQHALELYTRLEDEFCMRVAVLKPDAGERKLTAEQMDAVRYSADLYIEESREQKGK